MYMSEEDMQWAMASSGAAPSAMDPLMIGDFPILFGAFASPQAWAVDHYGSHDRIAFRMAKIDAENCPVYESARRIAERAAAAAYTGALIAGIDVQWLDEEWLVGASYRPALMTRRA